MRIPALALAQRALVLDARGNACLLRGLLVVLSMLALGIGVATSKWFGAPGLLFYNWLGYVNFWFIAAFGISAFTTVVTEEKENGTLGLLKMAGFGAISILAGKSIGQLLTMLLLLLVQVPFALLAFTLGGVSRYQILAGWLLLLAHLLFVYALGLLASVLAPLSSTAARIAALAMLGYYAVPMISNWVYGPGGGGPMQWLNETTALQGLQATMTNGYAEPLFSTPVIATLALAVVMFALATSLFARRTDDQVGAAAERPRRRRGGSRPRNHAVFWKDFAFTTGGVRGLALRFLAYGAVLLAVNLSVAPTPGFSIRGFVTLTILVLAGGLDLGNHCSRMFRDEDSERTLPMLMILPVPPWRWAYAKAAACACLVLPPLSCFCLWALLTPGDCRQLFEVHLSQGGAFYLVALVALGLHLAVLLSLVMQRGALAVALLVTYVGSMAISTFLSLTNAGHRTRVGVGLILLAVALGMHPAIFRVLRRRAGE